MSEPDGRIYYREYFGNGRAYGVAYKYPRRHGGGRTIYSGLDRAACAVMLARLKDAGWQMEQNGREEV